MTLHGHRAVARNKRMDLAPVEDRLGPEGFCLESDNIIPSDVISGRDRW